ncbi:hypothetical protein HPB49_025362 [Dermacentor silvarum]|uniref:Uncharacterized protein n=1 Tax=Dermacentor silvarum TaxID=543639 RepID=A0ACB8CIR7_DERSI|nr:hypothetical protein HPB49_025362 [Dermacentor silvarum]
MALAIKYYIERNVFNALEAARTVEFTERINGLIDAMNWRQPGDSVRKESKEILVMKESLLWLDDWERDLNLGVITKNVPDSINSGRPPIRQAAAENDHPDMPTSLQLYRMLAVYSLRTPPKFGNCEAR